LKRFQSIESPFILGVIKIAVSSFSDSVNQAGEISPMASLVLEHISACVSSVSLGYLDDNMTADVEDIMEQLLSSLSSPVPTLRLASYHLLMK